MVSLVGIIVGTAAVAGVLFVIWVVLCVASVVDWDEW